MSHEVYQHKKMMKYIDGKFINVEDTIANEFPLTLYVNKEEFATIVCTPKYLRELTMGFLASEGVIRKHSDIKNFHLDDSKGLCHIELANEVDTTQGQFTKRMISSCCGKSRQFYFVNDMKTSKVATTTRSIKPDEIFHLMHTMQSQSTDFKVTGGLHNAALSDGQDFYLHRNDIGRHNALDKLYGHCILNNISIKDKILIFSGRISSEILIKASKIGVGIILSKSAPTDLAIGLAEDLNITAVGFVRNDTFNVYSHPERIITD
ncbi:formate dehydrogenase accessory sulfurtransferase FdhD [Macrococcoides bohemicum]|uniref:Sulfur carrier protein FdhD n=1 Tax=Macrococcoides bohemicum TaxID=1903056 RepID=A0A328A5L4_9STAP|nr:MULTISPECIES: formate dehydrogenase accessory sulfurtransferase FdhD [Macrococcus]ATD31424.1 sufurtransferase FdhD [Macrococcus sp. IME1552]QRN48841.1 formate dehydrogenase accessory sulfurtransferase FdhD [Macrococcus bohemicus]QYA42593.1 formate dehydrogenase accessory sulfurtransferase FdhD [Macrococcus bohemicus]QYA44973.1 formate dehydrogenase accessory sulfurtransferase FdhD [Macrococcus bohemicus]RAK49780.1 formate dehydrogenase accessory sulfurtransferase FdhD [Macrococcus bohemicus